MNTNAIPFKHIACCRWSGETEPKPAIVAGKGSPHKIPKPLTRDQLEDTLVEALDCIQKLEKKIEELYADLRLAESQVDGG